MAEDRMLNDEILLGLIKKNGGGGTTNYNSLSNKPQIAGTELQGNKSLADLGIASAQDVKKEFIGTMDEWNALSPAQQKEYDTYQITDDYSEALMPNYSTAEQKTGQKWIDGKDIYFKVINTAITLAQLDTWYSSGLTGVDNIINYFPKLSRDGERIGDAFNGGTIDYVVRSNELLVKGMGFNLIDNYAIATQIVYYTKTA